MTDPGIRWFWILALAAVVQKFGDAVAQEVQPEETARTVPEEEVLELIDDEDASVSVSEILSWLHENPIDLNSARQDDFLSIPGLTLEEADAIVRARDEMGGFAIVDDISRLTGGEEMLARIRPYVYLPQTNVGRSANAHPLMVFCSRLSGFAPGAAAGPGFETLGSTPKSFSRFTLRPSSHLQVGGLFEKDAGERFQDGFASGYVAFRGKGMIDQIVLGDFTAEAGQGLVLWRGTDAGRNGDLVRGMRKSGARLVPYRQTDEAHFLRGGAIALRSKPAPFEARLLFMISRTSLAANIDDAGTVTSFYAGGLYRTDAELAKRNSVHELLAGTRLEGRIRGKGTVGLTCILSSFDRSVQPGSGFGFSGGRVQVTGGDFSIALGGATFFGEIARSQDGGMAWTGGAVLRLERALSVSAMYRNYSKDFMNPHARAYGIQSSSSNERGLSLALTAQLADGIALQGRADQCKIPTTTYTSILPRLVSDFLLEVTTLPAQGIRLSLALRMRRSEMMQPEYLFDSRRVQGDCDTRKVRVAGSFDISPGVRLKTRIERVVSRSSASNQAGDGNLVSQSLCYHAGGIEGECGAAFFDADSYDARLYHCEGNLSGAMAGLTLYGRGSRWHLLCSWTVFPCARLTAKYGVTLQERSPAVRELAVQAEMRF